LSKNFNDNKQPQLHYLIYLMTNFFTWKASLRCFSLIEVRPQIYYGVHVQNHGSIFNQTLIRGSLGETTESTALPNTLSSCSWPVPSWPVVFALNGSSRVPPQTQRQHSLKSPPDKFSRQFLMRDPLLPKLTGYGSGSWWLSTL
jgi:hypothetical protein